MCKKTHKQTEHGIACRRVGTDRGGAAVTSVRKGGQKKAFLTTQLDRPKKKRENHADSTKQLTKQTKGDFDFGGNFGPRKKGKMSFFKSEV